MLTAADWCGLLRMTSTPKQRRNRAERTVSPPASAAPDFAETSAPEPPEDLGRTDQHVCSCE